jgi:type I restriction enzyme S subunit
VIEVRRERPLVLLVDEAEAVSLETLDAGAAYTAYLHAQLGEFDECALGEFVEVVSETIDPRTDRYAEELFDYVDLREIDDLYGQVLKFRRAPGREIGSTKHRFRKWDLLFAKIMPSLANKKVAVVTQDVAHGVCSTEFIVLRKRPEVEIDLFYLFRALRSDHFTRQAVANVTGATGRQRINPGLLLSLRVICPPRELQERIGRIVEKEFTLRTLAAEEACRADDEAERVLGETSLRTARPASTVRARRSPRGRRRA